MRLDKSGHLCEPCASLYEDQMRAVLGGGAGLPSLDVVLLGLDSQGNSASFIKGHPIVSNEIHNYEVSVFLHAILIVCFLRRANAWFRHPRAMMLDLARTLMLVLAFPCTSGEQRAKLDLSGQIRW